MTSQLSQITTVEQRYNANEKPDAVSQELKDLSSAGLVDYLGKDIVLEGNEISVRDGETLGGISFTIADHTRRVSSLATSGEAQVTTES